MEQSGTTYKVDLQIYADKLIIKYNSFLSRFLSYEPLIIPFADIIKNKLSETRKCIEIVFYKSGSHEMDLIRLYVANYDEIHSVIRWMIHNES